MVTIAIKDLVEHCNISANIECYVDCIFREKCLLFKEFFGTTPYLMNEKHIQKCYNFKYDAVKDFVI